MLVAEPRSVAYTALPEHELLEIRRSKISLHFAKTGYSYPTIRLPHTYSKSIGLPAHIYQTVHDGALAFLVVVSACNKNEEKSPKNSKKPAITAKIPVFTRR
jgi:hypothetical protein